MPWAGFIDELKGWASYDISEWIVASAILTLVATKSLKNIFGQLQDSGQETRFLIATFLFCVAVFYLPT